MSLLLGLGSLYPTPFLQSRPSLVQPLSLPHLSPQVRQACINSLAVPESFTFPLSPVWRALVVIVSLLPWGLVVTTAAREQGRPSRPAASFHLVCTPTPSHCLTLLLFSHTRCFLLCSIPTSCSVSLPSSALVATTSAVGPGSGPASPSPCL